MTWQSGVFILSEKMSAISKNQNQREKNQRNVKNNQGMFTQINRHSSKCKLCMYKPIHQGI